MHYVLRAVFAGALGFAVSFVVACGGGAGLLSSDQAGTLNSQLDQVSSAIGSGQCTTATAAASAFGSAVDNLPPSVNATLVNNLKQGAATVAQLAAKDCRNQATTTTPTSTATTSSTSTHTTSTASTHISTSIAPPTNSQPATTPGGSGTTFNGGGTGGAGLPGDTSGSSGGAGAGNRNGNGP